MKNLTITFFLVTSIILGQTRGGLFEIYTEVTAGTTGTNYVNFELYDAGKIWENTKEDIFPLTTELDHAHVNSCKVIKSEEFSKIIKKKDPKSTEEEITKSIDNDEIKKLFGVE